MLVDPAEAESALMRYYNTTSAKKTGKKQVGPLWEPLAMVRARFSVINEPFLQVKLVQRGLCLACPSDFCVFCAGTPVMVMGGRQMNHDAAGVMGPYRFKSTMQKTAVLLKIRAGFLLTLNTRRTSLLLLSTAVFVHVSWPNLAFVPLAPLPCR